MFKRETAGTGPAATVATATAQTPTGPVPAGNGFDNWFSNVKPLAQGQRRPVALAAVQTPTGPVPVGNGFDNYNHRHPNRIPAGLVPVEDGLTTMDPIYTPHNTTPAYELNWGLTVFWRAAPVPADTWLADLQQATEPDGVRVLKHRLTTGDASQFFTSTEPRVPPSELIRSIKGRLQHLIREQRPKAFQRNYSIRSIGHAKRNVVENYVANQLGHHSMADPRVQERLAKFQKKYPHVDLSEPSFSAHGQFWHNLHLVMVNDGRWMEIRDEVLSGLSAMIERVAAKRGYRLSRVGLLPDHIHITMGCPIDRSPEEVALGFLNNCAFVCGMKAVFQFGYYVGTIGEYDRGAVS